MAIVDVELVDESQKRYLTYALSVVNGRALPDVRDGLKPVQRRILFAMFDNLHLLPSRPHRKSAAVVGEVLARFHPHGDAACYEAMVRLAQDFNLRYPLVDGQGNFGSLDGDSAAAYRYTEARLTEFALEVVGDLGQEAVAERDNFDQTVKEPAVLPSRVPNLLVNGVSGIAVGMATSIPPHNLHDVIKALQMLLDDPETSDKKLVGAIKGPDFPTGCAIVAAPSALLELYKTGRGPIRMRATYVQEKAGRGKSQLIFTSIPYGVDKSAIVEKIAELAIARKVPQITDVRDESTNDVRIVVELQSDADADKVAAFLLKQTPLESMFHANFTALVPTTNPLTGRPMQLSLRQLLEYFIEFRLDVVRRKLLFEKRTLDERIHLLEGLAKILDALNEVIKIIRKSKGRSDGAEQLRKRFGLSEAQSLFIVDLRIYQLSQTSVDEVLEELAEKKKRVAAIEKIVGSKAALRREVSGDLDRVAKQFGDKRRCEIVAEAEEVSVSQEEFLQHEDAWVLVTKDGWLKRIRGQAEPSGARLREGDSLSFSAKGSTRDSLAIFSTTGMVYVVRVYDLPATTGFGDPVQKVLKFADGEQIAGCLLLPRSEQGELLATGELFVWSRGGYGFRLPMSYLDETKRTGKRIARLAGADSLSGITVLSGEPLVFTVSSLGYAQCFVPTEVPLLSSPGKGVIIQRLTDDDALVAARGAKRTDTVRLRLMGGSIREFDVCALNISSRGKRGGKVLKRGGEIVGIANEGEV